MLCGNWMQSKEKTRGIIWPPRMTPPRCTTEYKDNLRQGVTSFPYPGVTFNEQVSYPGGGRGALAWAIFLTSHYKYIFLTYRSWLLPFALAQKPVQSIKFENVHLNNYYGHDCMNLQQWITSTVINLFFSYFQISPVWKFKVWWVSSWS